MKQIDEALKLQNDSIETVGGAVAILLRILEEGRVRLSADEVKRLEDGNRRLIGYESKLEQIATEFKYIAPKIPIVESGTEK